MKFLKKCQQELERRKLWEMLSYLFFGGWTTIVNLVIHFTCLNLFGWHYLVATVISWFGSVLFAFVTNKIWVFKSETATKRELFAEFSRFIFYRLLSLGLDAGLMFFLIDGLQIGSVLAKLITQVVVVLANYLFSKFLIFSRPNSQG